MKAYDLPMQVTDKMLDAAFDAYRAEQQRAGVLDWGLRREFLQAALQAAIDASPEQAMPRRYELADDAPTTLWLVDLPAEGIPLANGGVIRMATPEERAARMDQFRREIDELTAHRPRCRCVVEPIAAAPGDAIAHGPFHNEGGDFLVGPKRYRTRASAHVAPDELLSTDDFIDPGASALGSFTALLNGSDAFKLLNPDGVAEHLSVTTTQVDEWIRLGAAIRFPEPYKWVSGIPHWQIGKIDQWYALWKASNGG